jgi:hypothetical protein
MRYTLLIVIALLASNALVHAQIGINLGYRFNDATDWEITDGGTSGEAVLGDGFSVGLNYWIPMKAYRVDFLPEINYTQLQETSVEGLPANFNQNWWSFYLNTNFYLLDLEGDCDCPTFSKSGGIFEKGFFVMASPGISYLNQSIDFGDSEFTSESIAYSLGVGLGLDIGLSDFFTITPMATYRYHLPVEWEGLDQLSTEIPRDFSVLNAESPINQFYVGMRLGFRFSN